MAGLWSVDRDPDSHGKGELKADTGDSAPGTVKINNKKVIVGMTDAEKDNQGHINPKSKGNVPTVFAYNKPAHTTGDERDCGATTIVEGQTTVFVGTDGGSAGALTSDQEVAIAESAAAANSADEIDAGLAGVGEVPEYGDVTLLGEVEGENAFARLANAINGALTQANAGAWRERGNNGNILMCYRAVGFSVARDSIPWCAAFAGTMLKSAKAGYLKTLSSLAYRGYGTAVPLNDKSKWRLNDVVVFKRNGGGHIGFFRGYNPSNGAVLIAGGNQSNTLKESGFRGGGMPIVYVGRNWEVPAEYDKPVTYGGSGGRNRVV